jgi:hypothetical protein
MTRTDAWGVFVGVLWLAAMGVLLAAVLSTDGPSPCSIDAPMEQAQCRTLPIVRPDWLEVSGER